MNKYIKNTLILMMITVIAGVCLGGVYYITKDAIASQNDKIKKDAYNTVFSEAASFSDPVGVDEKIADYILKADEDLRRKDKDNSNAEINAVIDEIVMAYDVDGNKLGYVITVTDKEAYGGNITFTVGVSNERVIKGISFLSIEETPGLGMKAKDDTFVNQFKNKKSDYIMYRKSSNDNENAVDAISGATITSNAVTNGVCAAMYCFDYLEKDSR